MDDFSAMKRPLIAVTSDAEGRDVRAEIADGLDAVGQGRRVIAGIPFDERLSHESVEDAVKRVQAQFSQLRTYPEADPEAQQWAVISDCMKELQKRSLAYDRIERYLMGRTMDFYENRLEDPLQIGAVIEQSLEEMTPEKLYSTCSRIHNWERDNIDYDDDQFAYRGMGNDVRNIMGGLIQKSWYTNPEYTKEVLERCAPDLVENPERYRRLGGFAEDCLRVLEKEAQERRREQTEASPEVLEEISRLDMEDQWLGFLAGKRSLSEAAAAICSQAEEGLTSANLRAATDALQNAVIYLQNENALPFLSERIKKDLLLNAGQNGWPTVTARDFDAYAVAKDEMTKRPLAKLLSLGYSFLGKPNESTWEEILTSIQEGENAAGQYRLVGYPLKALAKGAQAVIDDAAAKHRVTLSEAWNMKKQIDRCFGTEEKETKSRRAARGL